MPLYQSLIVSIPDRRFISGNGYLNTSVVESNDGILPTLHRGQILQLSHTSLLVRIESLSRRPILSLTVDEMLKAGFEIPKESLKNIPREWFDSEGILKREDFCKYVDTAIANGDTIWAKIKNSILQSFIQTKRVDDPVNYIITIIHLKPYALYDKFRNEYIRNILYIDSDDCYVYYFDASDSLQSCYCYYREHRQIFTHEQIEKTSSPYIEALRKAGSLKASDVVPYVIRNITRGYIGKSRADIEKILGEKIERHQVVVQKEEQRKRFEKKLIEKYPELFQQNTASIIYLPKLDWDVDENDFRIRIPLRRYWGDRDNIYDIAYADNVAYLKKYKKQFFAFVGARIRNEPQLMDRIGDLSFYRISDCTILTSYEVEILFSPKKEIEEILSTNAV